jgi:hypothetical protein
MVPLDDETLDKIAPHDDSWNTKHDADDDDDTDEGDD